MMRLSRAGDYLRSSRQIAATCGRDRADEFDFRMDRFSKEVISLSQDKDNKGLPQ
jgi:hypothetical protein